MEPIYKKAWKHCKATKQSRDRTTTRKPPMLFVFNKCGAQKRQLCFFLASKQFLRYEIHTFCTLFGTMSPLFRREGQKGWILAVSLKRDWQGLYPFLPFAKSKSKGKQHFPPSNSAIIRSYKSCWIIKPTTKPQTKSSKQNTFFVWWRSSFKILKL